MRAQQTSGTAGQPPGSSSLSLPIAEHAPQPMAVVEGVNHRVCYVNPAFCRLIGKNREELAGKTFAEIMPDSVGCLGLLDRVYRTGEPESHTEQGRSEPHPVYWSYTMWPAPGAGERGVVIQVTETAKFHQQSMAISEALMLGSVRQHELTEAADQLNIQLQAEIAERARLLDLSNDAIVVRDLEGRIAYWNQGAEKLYGWPAKEAVGKVVYSLLQTEFPKPLEQIVAELHRNNFWTGELVQTKRDGQRITTLSRWVLDRDEEGNPGAILASDTDITARKRAEEKLEETVAERTAKLRELLGELETFSYSITHDMRAPLRAMQSFARLLAEDCGEAVGEVGRDYIRRIITSSDRMDKLIQDVLAYNRGVEDRLNLGKGRSGYVVTGND